jgi:hypothetical protein
MAQKKSVRRLNLNSPEWVTHMRLIFSLALITLCHGLTLGQKPAPVRGKSSDDLRAQISSLQDGRVRLAYDRFQDSTSVGGFGLDAIEVDPSRSPNWLKLDAVFTFAGPTLSKPVNAYLLTFNAGSDRPLFTEYHNLDLLADGERFHLGSGKREMFPMPSGVSELLAYQVTAATLEKLAGAKSVEYRLGFLEGTLSADVLQMFKNLIALATLPPK